MVNKLFLFVFILFSLFMINLKKIDNYFLNETLKDFSGKFYFKEIWRKYNDNDLNYKWIRKFNYVVHGINEIKKIDSCKLDNTKEFSLYEINFFNLNNKISLSSTKYCSIDNILDLLKKKKNYIIVDIKDEFNLFSKEILEFAEKNNIIDKIIFQIYKPENLELYFQYLKKYYNLPGPIITTYKSRRSIGYLSKTAKENKIKVLTVNNKKLVNIDSKFDIDFFIFPVNSCNLYNNLKNKNYITGMYINPKMKCLKKI